MSMDKELTICKDSHRASWGNIPISATIHEQIQNYLRQRQSIGLSTDVEKLISTAIDEFRDFQQRPGVKVAMEMIFADLSSDLAFSGLNKDERNHAIVINFAIANYLKNVTGK